MKTTFLPKLFFLLLLILFAKNLYAQTEHEPNNIPAKANTLALNGSKSGALNAAGDVDWYKVTTNSDGELFITLNNTGNPDIKYVSLYDTAGTVLLTNAGVGNGIGGISMDGLAAGTFYIEINGKFGNETGAYNLSDSLAVPAKANDKEPNNNITQADVLNVNDSVQGHLGYYYNQQRDSSDWYKVTTTADGQLDIKFDNTGNPDLKTIILYDTTGSPALNSTNVGNGIGGFNTNGLAAGTYYVQITGGAGGNNNQFGPYTLSDSLEVAIKANDKEPNNNFSEADNLAINDSTTGHIGYYYNHQRDSSDWYKLNIANKGRLTLTLDNSGNPDLITLNLYDASGVNLINTANIGNGRGGFQTDTLTPGIYYVQITGGAGGNNNQFGSYTLIDSLSGNALPVTLLNFDIILQDDKAVLSWSTADEINNKGFEVEKSADGKVFSSIGFVLAHGNSGKINNYNFSDAQLFSGFNYYRLKQIDNDGKFDYSSTIKLNFSKFDWLILNNASTISVQLQLNSTSNVSLLIISLNGKVIQTINKGILSAGTYSIPANLNNVSAGIYVVSLIIDNKLYSKKIIK